MTELSPNTRKRMFVIAEIGINHNGSEELALEMIGKAAKANADCVKFQTFSTELTGEHDSLGWDLPDLHRLVYFDHGDEGRLRGWRSIHVTEHDGTQPYMDRWWGPGLQIGYEHSCVHQVADFLTGLASGAGGGA